MQLRLENVGKWYGRRRVFDGVSLELAHGECLVVTGPNGSGKSTLITVLAGLQRPTTGVIRLCEKGAALPREAWRHVVGWVAPDLTLYPELSARENLDFFARVLGRPADAARRDRLLARVGLAGRENDLVRAYSTGMRVRLKYAFALLNEPRLLLLDEPTATLDADGMALVDEIIAEQRCRGLLVLATNDPREIRHGDWRLDLGSGSALQ
ncbi:MAG: heme ABC exporter ATP-binding protein CcmA [Armatimonadetes bacterium]|nr:heme ABC exporter ATP-binding protein CcmA [Armatimonadota bacterium]